MLPTDRPVRLAASLLLAIGLAACSSSAASDPPGSTPAATPAASPSSSAVASGTHISVKDFKFTPDRVAIPAGSTVTWTNNEDSLHTVTSGTPDAPSGLFDSGEIDTGVEFPFTFEKAGTYPFFCMRHDFMRGEVAVTP